MEESEHSEDKVYCKITTKSYPILWVQWVQRRAKSAQKTKAISPMRKMLWYQWNGCKKSHNKNLQNIFKLKDQQQKWFRSASKKVQGIKRCIYSITWQDHNFNASIPNSNIFLSFLCKCSRTKFEIVIKAILISSSILAYNSQLCNSKEESSIII